MKHRYIKYQIQSINRIIFRLLLLLSLYLYLSLSPAAAFAESQDEQPSELAQQIQQEIDRVNKLIYSKPKTVLSQVNAIRSKYKNKLSLLHQATLIGFEAWSYTNTNQFQLALDKIDKINQLNKPEINNFDWIVNNTKGFIYWHMGQGQQALKHHLLAYEDIKNKPSFVRSIITTENNIGYTSVQLGFYQQALPYLERVLAYNLKQDNPSVLAISYNNIGEALFHLKQVDKALSYHRKALAIRIKHEIIFHASYSYHNLGVIYHHRKNYRQAKENLLKAIKIRVDNSYMLGILESQLVLAKVYQETSEHSVFSELLVDIIANATKHKLLNSLAHAYELQSEFFKGQGVYQHALTAYENYHKTLENVQLKKTDFQLAQYITKSSTVSKDINILQLQKENEIQQLEVENQQKRAHIIFAAAIIIVAVLSVSLWLLQLKRRKIQAINQYLSVTLHDLKATQGKLIESEKMSALTTLVSGMAHQINTPLGVAITSVSVIKDKVDTFFEAVNQGQVTRMSMTLMLNDTSDASKLALSAMDKTAKLVTQFKMISAQLEGDKQQEFELAEHLINQADLIMGQLNNNQLEINVHGSNVKISSYPSALGKVLAHLVNNSIEHGFINTEVPKIDIEIKALAQSVTICYQDNGKGIDSEKISKIFDPFYTSKMGSDNVGLGLSIVYNLVVQLMQGSISVEPSTDAGTTFNINLPMQLTALS
ncbi:MAG: tetratricopeptide repeat-containing sensor histidine kinase [Colwellia sp.]|nr:tetratricopeptide repeat-containing sensor histidine kinase [Colwellia sp.]